ncbi:hypothetical protein RIVM261_012770 [Rivularia sp. IAM M-261]|nr:hypothetical protein CAL7716_071850 [Calothrix sp. PCC 7716]GJD16321.1 hypothetical protein RIVM261_012770 [Rivularia sp. IAM M-261]
MSQISKNDSKSNSASDDNTSQGIRDIGVLAFLAVLAMLTINSGAFGSNESITSKITHTAEITDETDDFSGKTVTVRSKPIQRISLRSFAVTDKRVVGGKPIVVINASGVPFDLPKDANTEVQVTGQVRELDIPKIERDFKLNIQDEYYKDYINQPAIIARYITLAPKPGQVATNPEQFYGKRVAMMGKVKDIQSPNLLKLDDGNFIGGKNLPILFSQKPKVAINEGQTVVVMGRVSPFVAADIQRNYKMNWNSDVKRQLEAEYANTPVLIAENVYP